MSGLPRWETHPDAWCSWCGDEIAEDDPHDRCRRAIAMRTYRRVDAGTGFESWLFAEDERAFRCRWPTAACAGYLERMCHDSPTDLDPRLVASVLAAYRWLVADPLGVEHAIERLRAIHRAERSGP